MKKSLILLSLMMVVACSDTATKVVEKKEPVVTEKSRLKLYPFKSAILIYENKMLDMTFRKVSAWDRWGR